MIDRTYTRDSSVPQWAACADDPLASRDIAEIPTRLIAGCRQPPDKRAIWCPAHQCFEGIAADDKAQTISQAGCQFTGPYILLAELPEEIPPGTVMASDASRWRVYQKEPQAPIMIAADTALLRISRKANRQDRSTPAQVMRINWTVRSMSLDVARDKFFYYALQSPTSPHHIWPMIPDLVVEDIFPVLLQEAQARYGAIPLAEDPYSGFEKLQKFMDCPLNRNIFVLQKILQNRNINGLSFAAVFPKGQKEYWPLICRFLHIENPPEELKAACERNPYTACNYRLYRDFGFTDVNAIALLWENEHCFGQPLDALRYDDGGKPAVSSPRQAPRKSLWQKRTADFLAWWLYERTETEAAQVLRDTYYQQTDARVPLKDMLDLFREYRQRFPAPLLDRFKREGFTFAVYEAMKKAALDLSYQYAALHPPALAERFEANINGYNFRLVRHTLYLRRISEALHSRLDTCCAEVIRQSYLVYTIDLQGIYIAYIKVAPGDGRQRHGFEVIDLCGDGDGPVPIGIGLLCYYWAAAHRFGNRYGFLSRTPEARFLYQRTRYTMQPLAPESILYDNYRLEELLDFPPYARKDGYYPVLAKRLRENSDLPKLSLPPWQQGSDGKSALLLLLPWLKQVITAAYDGNPEAEYIMGLLYGADRYLPQDKEKQLAWLRRAAHQGYVPAIEDLAWALLEQGQEKEGRALAIRAAKRGSEAAFQWCRAHVSPAEYAITG